MIITTDSGTVTLTPQNTQSGAKVTVSVSGNTVTLAGLWKGVTCYFILTPERPVIHFMRTASVYVNPQILCSDPAPMMSAYYMGADGMPVHLAVTEAAGVVVYPLGDAPLNARVM